MTGIELLRKFANDHISNSWSKAGKMRGRLMLDIADQIERERACDADTIENVRLIVGGVIDDMERHCLGHEGMEDSPVARWARELREALGGEEHDPAAEREAIAWVRDADGVEIRVGDEVYEVDTGEKMWVCALPKQGEYQCLKLRLINGMFQTLDPCRVTHRAPVLAADGLPLREGETVWDKDGTEWTVACIGIDFLPDCVQVRGADRTSYVKPSQLTHERPDSYDVLWEDIENCAIGYTEFVRRAKALAERGQ